MATERVIPLSGTFRFTWWVRCFCLIFFLAGAYGTLGMIFGFGHFEVGGISGLSHPATPADAWLPGLIAVTGFGVLLIRNSTVLDVDRRLLIRSIGWGPWIRSTEISLTTATSIVIGPVEERGSGSGRFTVCPVSAAGVSGSRELADTYTYKAARELAERIARALRIPVESGSLGGKAGNLVGTLGNPTSGTDRIDAGQGRSPVGSRARTYEVSRGFEIRYPMAGLGFAAIVMNTLVPLALGGGFWWFVWRPVLAVPATKSAVMWLFMMAPILLGALAGGVNLLMLRRSGLFGVRILIDREGLLVVSGRRIPRGELISVDVAKGRGVTSGLRIVLQTSDFLTARGQSVEELEWIREQIIQGLGGPLESGTSANDASG